MTEVVTGDDEKDVYVKGIVCSEKWESGGIESETKEGVKENESDDPLSRWE